MKTMGVYTLQVSYSIMFICFVVLEIWFFKVFTLIVAHTVIDLWYTPRSFTRIEHLIIRITEDKHQVRALLNSKQYRFRQPGRRIGDDIIFTQHILVYSSQPVSTVALAVGNSIIRRTRPYAAVLHRTYEYWYLI